jgi:HSP20 family protein
MVKLKNLNNNNEYEYRIIDCEEYNKPLVNVVEDTDNYKIFIATPGLDKEEIVINITNYILEIKGEKKDKFIKEIGSFNQEISVGPNYYLIFKLPEFIIKENVDVTYYQGLLKFKFKKKELSNKQNISIT